MNRRRFLTVTLAAFAAPALRRLPAAPAVPDLYTNEYATAWYLTTYDGRVCRTYRGERMRVCIGRASAFSPAGERLIDVRLG